MNFKNNRYSLQDIDVLDLANKYGTPLYVYDTKKMKEQYEKLTSAFPNTKLKVKYACKSLTNINILKYFKSLGAG